MSSNDFILQQSGINPTEAAAAEAALAKLDDLGGLASLEEYKALMPTLPPNHPTTSYLRGLIDGAEYSNSDLHPDGNQWFICMADSAYARGWWSGRLNYREPQERH